jgi:hypothetical protein
MSDTNRLREHLAQLATAAQSSGTREILGKTGEELKVKILREIDKIILPRRISFQNERNHYVLFEIAARRVFRFKFSNSSPQIEEGQGLDGPLLESTSSALFNDLNEQLNAFLANSRLLKVDIRQVEFKSDLSQVGCSVNSLASTWSLDLYSKQPNLKDAFLSSVIETCSEGILASIVFESGKRAVESGDQSCLARMKEIDPDQLEDLKAKFVRRLGGNQDNGCIVFDMGTTNGTALAIIQEADTFALICIASSAAPKTLSRVQAILK